MIIYEVCYNPMIMEGGYLILSLHKTKEGAEKALEKHKEMITRECKKELEKNPYLDLMQFKDWAIFEMPLLD